MDWKSHLIIGFLLGAAVAYFFFPAEGNLLLFSSVSGFSALLPDLDLRKSKASKLLYAILAAGILAAAFWLSGGRVEKFVLYAGALSLAAVALDRLVRPRHRGVMHSLLFLAIAAAASFWLFGTFFASAFALGYFSHLLADFSLKFK